MPKTISILATSIILFLVLYMSILVSELLGNTSFFLYLRNEQEVPIAILRIAILSLIASPIAYLASRTVIKNLPSIGLQSATLAVVLFACTIVAFQIFIYEPSVLVSSLMKIIFPSVPVLLLVIGHSSRGNFRGNGT